MMIVDERATRHADRVADTRRKLAKAASGYYGRTRGLHDLEERFAHADASIERAVADRVTAGPVRVLEIGCGWGRALLDLSLRFPHDALALHGVNLDRKPPVEGPEDFAAVAEVLGLVPEHELAAMRLPTPHFEDATYLHFPDESFDVVYSAVCLRWIPDKVRVIEHVARVLRPGGRALLHIGEANWQYSAGSLLDERLLTDRPCRLVVHDGTRLVPVERHVTDRSDDRFTLRLPPGGYCSLVVDKHASGHLDLGLVLDERATIPMREFPHPDRPGGTNGVRSAYRLR